MEAIFEKNTCRIRVSFWGEDGEPVTPTTFHYKVNDKASDQEIRAATPIVPAEEITITFTTSDNTLVNQASEYEIREVTLLAVFGASEQLNWPYSYRVNNLEYYS